MPQHFSQRNETNWLVSLEGMWVDLLLSTGLQIHLLKVQQQIIWIEENFVGWVCNSMCNFSCCFNLPQSHKRRVIGNSLSYQLPTLGFSLVIKFKIRKSDQFSPGPPIFNKWIASCKTSRKKLVYIVHISSHPPHLCSNYSTSLVLFSLLDNEFSSFGFLGSHLLGFDCSCKLLSKS